MSTIYSFLQRHLCEPVGDRRYVALTMRTWIFYKVMTIIEKAQFRIFFSWSVVVILRRDPKIRLFYVFWINPCEVITEI